MSRLRQLNEQKFCGWCGAEVIYKSEWMSECTSCKYRKFINPNPCSNIIVVKDNSILMVKRAIEPGLGKYDLPGGFAEVTDQSMEDATLREFEEELGISRNDVTALAYLGSKKSPTYEWQGTAVQNFSFYYVCELKDGAQIMNLDLSENSEITWITKQDLPNIDFAWDIDKQMLEKYFEEAL